MRDVFAFCKVFNANIYHYFIDENQRYVGASTTNSAEHSKLIQNENKQLKVENKRLRGVIHELKEKIKEMEEEKRNLPQEKMNRNNKASLKRGFVVI